MVASRRPQLNRPGRTVRSSRAPSVAELLRRVAALEERMARLETGKPPPGDGRSGLPSHKRAGKRCPGCGLPLRARGGRCTECGLPLR